MNFRSECLTGAEEQPQRVDAEGATTLSFDDSSLGADIINSSKRAFRTLDEAFELVVFGVSEDDRSGRFGLVEDSRTLLSSDQDRSLGAVDVCSHVLGDWQRSAARESDGVDLVYESMSIYGLMPGIVVLANRSSWLVFPTAIVKREYYTAFRILRLPRLKSSCRAIENRPSLARCLVDVVIDELDRRMSNGAIGGQSPSPRELLYRAADRLLVEVGQNKRGDGLALSGLFCELMAISTFRYERRETAARLLLVPPSESDLCVRLESPIPFGDHRAARKILEMASAKIPAVASLEKILGLGRWDASGHLLEVRFHEFHSWSIYNNGEAVLTVVAGIPHLPRGRVDEETLRSVIVETFGDAADPVVLIDAAREVAAGSKGALLVVSANASEEATRLSSQATADNAYLHGC